MSAWDDLKRPRSKTSYNPTFVGDEFVCMRSTFDVRVGWTHQPTIALRQRSLSLFGRGGRPQSTEVASDVVLVCRNAYLRLVPDRGAFRGCGLRARCPADRNLLAGPKGIAGAHPQRLMQPALVYCND